MSDQPPTNADLLPFGSIVDQLMEGFHVVDRTWRYIYLNDEACRQGRRERANYLGRTVMECFPGVESTELYAQMKRCMDEGVPGRLDFEIRFPRAAKGLFDIQLIPIPQGIAVLSHEITERRRLEEQARHSQKMEAVGRLASGVAHDFNNLLTAILTFGQFALEAVPEGHEAAADMAEVLTAARRAEALVKQLLAFSRRTAAAPAVTDLNQLVSGLEPMLATLLGEGVEVANKLSPSIWPVRIDSGAFEQVLVNLAVNARDAMSGQGRLAIGTSNAVLDHSVVMARGTDVVPGDYVVVTVSDTGSGMDESVRERLFEPYFTTKPPGQGTGLGLSTCWGIVRQAGGHIWVYSEPGAGAQFKVYLPRADAPPLPIPAESDAPAARGTETVLVVEDDAQVRRLAVRTLEKCGYTVLNALTGHSALDIVASHPGKISLLVTDVVMPRMSGMELAERVTRRHPDIRVLFISGYSEDLLGPGRPMLGPLLEKPFTAEQLALVVRGVLDGSS